MLAGPPLSACLMNDKNNEISREKYRVVEKFEFRGRKTDRLNNIKNSIGYHQDYLIGCIAVNLSQQQSHANSLCQQNHIRYYEGMTLHNDVIKSARIIT
jgi:hypothetical protein